MGGGGSRHRQITLSLSFLESNLPGQFELHATICRQRVVLATFVSPCRVSRDDQSWRPTQNDGTHNFHREMRRGDSSVGSRRALPLVNR